MKRNIPVYFSEDELYLLQVSVNHYMADLEESYKRSNYFYSNYTDEYRRETSQKNMNYIMNRMYQMDCLKNRLMSHCPVLHDYF